MINQDSGLDKWIGATINIESEAIPGSKASPKSLRVSGTAIFLQWQERYYLITARHTVADGNSVNSLDVHHKIFLANYSHPNKMLQQTKNASDLIDASLKDSTFLINLSAGPYFSRPYVFSSQDHDMALVDISARMHAPFSETLLRRGYVPIIIEDIDHTGNVSPGQEIIAIGYPEKSRRELIQPGESRDISALKTVQCAYVANGNISKVFEQTGLFEGNIHVYHGTNGGPVVSSNKMVGMVSRIVSELKITANGFNYFIRRPIFTKSSVVLDMIKEIQEKQKLYPRLFR